MQICHVTNHSPFHPLTKMAATILLGFTPLVSMHAHLSWLLVVVFAGIFVLEHHYKAALSALIWYALLAGIIAYADTCMTASGTCVAGTCTTGAVGAFMAPLIRVMYSFIYMLKVFYVPMLAAKWLISTTDVGNMLAALDSIRVPSAISIPLCVMLRFFPAYREDSRAIKQALTMRDITLRHPIMYAERFCVPMLIVSCKLADELAKAAETKGIANPAPKTHYQQCHFHACDGVCLALMLACIILACGCGGLWCSR